MEGGNLSTKLTAPPPFRAHLRLGRVVGLLLMNPFASNHILIIYQLLVAHCVFVCLNTTFSLVTKICLSLLHIRFGIHSNEELGSIFSAVISGGGSSATIHMG